MSRWNINITCPRCRHVGDVDVDIPCDHAEALAVDAAHLHAALGWAGRLDLLAKEPSHALTAFFELVEKDPERAKAAIVALRMGLPGVRTALAGEGGGR